MAFINLINKITIGDIILRIGITNAILFPIIDIYSNKDVYSDWIKNNPIESGLRLCFYTTAGFTSALLFPITLPILIKHLYQNNGKFNIECC